MSKTFVVGDIHGNHRGLLQVIERSGIDKDKDTLITLGDVVDGYPDVVAVVDELLTFKNLIPILGNHDLWFYHYLLSGKAADIWLMQGGNNTFRDYLRNPGKDLEHKEKYFSKALHYYYDQDRNYVFVHGGFDWHGGDIRNTSQEELLWNRHMVETAQTWQINYDTRDHDLIEFPYYNKIFVGHTDTRVKYDGRYEPSTKPQFLSNLINLDTGAGAGGKLTIMDIDSFEYWQSDDADVLYPNGYKREEDVIEELEKNVEF
jgi:serine/threonine protein phosphatase 1